MMINKSDREFALQAPDGYGDAGDFASSSAIPPPPPFEDVPETQALIDVSAGEHLSSNDGILEPPPDFAPYEADYFETGYGDIVSHDPHLNSDGEALYRFLLAWANKSPSYRVHCRGTHTEHHTHWVRDTNREGRSISRRETRTETITDFDFYIDIGPGVVTGPVHWSVSDADPVYRGLMVCETEVNGDKRTVKRKDREAHRRWVKERTARGLPPWVTGTENWSEGTVGETDALRSSKTLRQWADEYCTSQKYLKEFVYNKVLYGWNIQQLEGLIRSSISMRYQGQVQVEFESHGSKIYIRSDNWLSRTLSNKWLKFLSIILLIFPFIWLFKRFHSRGGGRWEVCGGGYALKRWERAEDPTEEESPPKNHGNDGEHTVWNGPMPTSPPSSRYMETPNGRLKLVGLKEGDWFRQWEGAITRGVLGRYQSSTPLFNAGQYNDLF